ncbi:MAG TPA: ligase-associated DNA damage response endonuclease PdeM [Gemmatimonadaceae bacterium]|jgi:DNA ligase-associated metallophosphoesterase|nr:ligase-associated DNA damage response endonuclease PdeM [Gemmatimonadaceae bacterium]
MSDVRFPWLGDVMEGDLSAEIAEEWIVLMAERTAFWPVARTLLVADTHFGKAASFRAAGVPVPRGTTSTALKRLSTAIARSGAARVVFLGDFLHAREGREPETTRVVAEWRRQHSGVDMVLVRGNHDARAGDPGPEIDIRCVDAPLVDPPFVFTHKPTVSDAGYVMCGHVHPAARLTGAGREWARMPCFWVRPRVTVLPAFGEFTGSADIEPEPGDQVFVVAGDAVYHITGG